MLIQPADRTKTVQEYYFSQKLRQIAQMRGNGKDIINLGIGSPDLPPSPATIKQLQTAAEKPENHAYQSYIGIPELRGAFSGWYKQYFNVDLNPLNEIMPLMGSKEGIMHLSMAFVNPGEQVLVPNPGYPTYSAVSRIIGAGVVYYDLTAENNWLPDFSQLEQMDLSRVKLLWVNYPHMPTGSKASGKLFRQLTEFGIKHNILIVNDNPYSFILNDEPLSILSVPDAKNIAIELNSLSKSHNMAGWRIGMAAGNAGYIKSILKIKSNMDSGMFLPLQLAAIEALKNPDDWYFKLNESYGERKKYALEILNILNCTCENDQAGMFLWAKIPESIDSSEIFSETVLYNANIFIAPGFIFGSNGERYVRMSLCADIKTFKKAIKRLRPSV